MPGHRSSPLVVGEHLHHLADCNLSDSLGQHDDGSGHFRPRALMLSAGCGAAPGRPAGG